MSLHNHTYTNPPTIGLITLKPGAGGQGQGQPDYDYHVWSLESDLLSVQSSLGSGVQLEPGTDRPSEDTGEVTTVSN